MHNYRSAFFDYINEGSLRSARVVVPLVLDALKPKSVLDIGCGQGAWLKVWQDHGVVDLRGIDGPYIDRNRLLVSGDLFSSANLSEYFSAARTFEVVQSLEVAEHLPAESAEMFVRSITTHGETVMFSAATPGQGGENHINEQWPEYWRTMFGKCGYVIADYVRPLIAGNRDVELWYRHNIFLYLRKSALDKYSRPVRASIVPSDRAIPSMASWPYRVSAAVLSKMPTKVVSGLARAKHKGTRVKRWLSKLASP